MTKTLPEKLPFLLLFSGFVGLWGGLFFMFPKPADLPWYLYAAGLMALLGFFLHLRRKKTAEELRRKAKQQELEEKKNQIADLEKRLKDDMLELDKRILKFNQKLKTYHEWMEFPTDLKFAETYEEGKTLNAQDQAVMTLLKSQTEYFFENIKNKKYYKNSQFNGVALGEDIIALTEAVARIYNPNSQQPLLQVSIEQLLRAVNQISIHLLVLLDGLPVNIKKRTLQETYNYVQIGVKGFEFYEKAEPYLDYMQPLYYFGRMVLGANPVTLGATALAIELGKAGAKHLTLHISAKYALRLLHETICIFANEMATLFGDDYRHRDANWIYGVELTDLSKQFPVSQEILQASLNEIGNLNLRSEYDRLFLYRCIAAHQTAHPEKHPQVYHFLTDSERQNVAKGLEKFYNRFIYGRTPQRVQAWKGKVEARLGCKLHLEESSAISGEPSTLISNGLFSLASFLLEIKDREIAEIPDLLATTHLATHLENTEQPAILKSIQQEPPMIFSYPELEPTSEFLTEYLQDLLTLNVEVAPYDKRGDQIFSAVIQYFRLEENEFLENLKRQYVKFFEKQMLPQSPERKIEFDLARPILAVLQPDESPRFLYKNITLAPPFHTDSLRTLVKKRELLLLGTPSRLLLLAIAPQTPADKAETAWLWQSDHQENETVRAQGVKNKLIDDCRLVGGRWNREIVPEQDTPEAVLVSGTFTGRYEKYFRPLLKFCQAS